jgi:uncharacterized protein YbjT (DUF2867 family)
MRFTLPCDIPVFEGYTPALKALERALRKAGMRITFLADVSPDLGKKVHIRKSGKIIKTICIEGDSPAQAVKDVAGAAPL